MAVPESPLLAGIFTPHSLTAAQPARAPAPLVYTTLTGLPWEVTEVMFENELVFVIKKQVV